MLTPGDFIGDYRIIQQISSDSIATIYLVEHPSQGINPLLLTLWHNLTLNMETERAFFLSSVANLSQVQARGIVGNEPYLVTPYDAQDMVGWRDRLTRSDQEFQAALIGEPYNKQAQIEAFFLPLGVWVLPEPTVHAINDDPTIVITPPEPPLGATNSTPTRPASRPRATRSANRNRGCRRFLIALLLILLIIGAIFLYQVIPARAATVTITPLSRRITQTQQVVVSASKPGAGEIAGRAITYTTPVQTKTVAATGHGHQDAQAATGSLVMSQPSTSSDIADEQALTSNSGVVIVTDETFSLTVGQSTTVTAHAENPGPGGDIGAYDISGTYDIIDEPSQHVVGQVYVQNPQPFTGGSDAYDYIFVQQADIDSVVTPLSAQMMPQAQQKAQGMVKPGEQLAAPIACTDQIHTDHQALDQAQNVTINFSVVCKGEVYNIQDAQTAARVSYTSYAQTTLGPGYVPDGTIILGNPQTDNIGGDPPTLDVSADAVWVYLFGPNDQRELAQALAGKAQRDASPLLLQTRGVKSATLQVAFWFGNALPNVPGNIKFVITSVPGLVAPQSTPQSTPTPNK